MTEPNHNNVNEEENDEPDQCRCALENGWDPGVSTCARESPEGRSCTKPIGHTGPHSACSTAEHPAEVWEEATMADGGDTYGDSRSGTIDRCPKCGRLVNRFVNGNRCPACHEETFEDDGVILP